LGGDAFEFNQADSRELALYAFTNGLDVGVDIEYMRPIPDAQQIVDGSFSKQEKADFNALSDRKKQEAFFNCWTRKEAYIKAIGEGLYFPLDQFAVSLSPGEPCRLLHVAGQPEEASRWSLKSFTPEINYKAALAVRCNDCNISYWRFPW
jgi:4'-phosphopantetheinyl transferase